MLTITRSRGQRVRIEDDIELRVLSIGPAKVRLQVIAPRRLRVLREELRRQREQLPEQQRAG